VSSYGRCIPALTPARPPISSALTLPGKTPFWSCVTSRDSFRVSTLVTWELEFSGAPIRIVFSGDTIVEREHWGTQALAFGWPRHAGRLKRERRDVPLYWFLIVKGQRTYRYLPTFACEFLPDWRGAPAPHLAELLTVVAREKFGEAYDPATGLI
jgi:hypothetical protein